MATESLGKIVIIGSSGHAVAVAEAARLAGWRVVGYISPETSSAEEILGLHLGNDEALLSLAQKDRELCCVCGIGFVNATSRMRRNAVILKLTEIGIRLATVIHPHSFVSPSATVGDGTFIGPAAIVGTGAEVGDNVIINSGAVVEHDCRIADRCHIATTASLAGNVLIGEDTLVGIGAKIKQNVKLGTNIFVGGGVFVRHNVEDDAVIYGCCHVNS